MKKLLKSFLLLCGLIVCIILWFSTFILKDFVDGYLLVIIFLANLVFICVCFAYAKKIVDFVLKINDKIDNL